MAHSLSAKKRIRQNEKRRSRNRWRKTALKGARKEFDDTLAHGTPEQAAEKLRQLTHTVDRLAAKKTIHKNAASRRKSRAAKAMNKKFAKTAT